MDFLKVVQDGSLLVDDTQCTGLGPTTSIYGPKVWIRARFTLHDPQRVTQSG